MNAKMVVAAVAAMTGALAGFGAQSPSSDPRRGADARRVAEIAALLDERPSWCGKSAKAPPATKAEEMLAQPIPECRDEDYLLITTTGDRTTYQKPFFKRMNTMLGLARFAAETGDARCLRRVADYLDAMAGMRSWKLPAHDKQLSDFRGETASVDLGAAHYVAAIAETLSIVGDRLPPATVARIRAACERRIFAPYRAVAAGKAPPTGPHWWFFGSNNWNAVCHADVVVAALALVDGRDDRAGFVEAAERGLPFFLAGFLDDGYCSEGGGYWNYGYGHFLSLVSAVRRATRGRVDFGSLPTAERPMRYGFLYRLVGDLCPNFADGESEAADRRFLAAGAEIWPDLKPMLTSPLPPRTWFPSGEVYIGRAGNLAFAVKGGNNQEKHNHNDVGSWDLVVDGVPIAGDPQGEVYTARTFSKDRYVSNVLNSYGHPVPVVGGEGQAFGAAFKAEVASMSFADDRDALVLDIAKAYPNPPRRLVRTVTLERGDAPSVTIRDEVAFDEPKAFETVFVTYGEVEKSADGRTLLVTARTEDGKKTARLRVAVETSGGGDWTWTSETIENPGRPSPHRWAVRFVRPVRTAAVAFVMTPEKAEAAVATVIPATNGPCVCGVAPERASDFYWENDKVGFRAYGPGDYHLWSGIDVFNKGHDGVEVESLLRHNVKGRFGAWHNLATLKGGVRTFDNYAVGAGRGVGGVAFWGDGEWKTYPDWETCEVHAASGDLISFTLVYPAFAGSGKMSCRITMKKGEPFFRNEVSFEKGVGRDFRTGPGLDVNPSRGHDGDLFESKELGVVSLFENPKKDAKGNDEGSTMTAVFVEDPSSVEFMTDHQGCRVLAFKKQKFVYWAGASWSGRGEFTTPEAWHGFVREFQKRQRNSK